MSRPEKIMMLCGDDIYLPAKISDRVERSSLRDLAEEWKLPQDERYDQIMITGHGSYHSNQNNARSDHGIMATDKLELATDSVVEVCAKHTDKIFVSSCYAGALLKDLRGKNLGGAQVVAVDGSKYPLVLDSTSSLNLWEEFSHEGVDNLYQFAERNYAGSVGIVSADGTISKLGSVKLQADGSLKRYYSVPNPAAENGEKWWMKSDEITLDPNELSSDFKNFALALAIQKGRENEISFWQQNGADINAKMFADGEYNLLQVAASDGRMRVLNRLLDVEGVNKRVPRSTSHPLFLAALNGHEEAVDVILGKLSDEEILQDCERLPFSHAQDLAPLLLPGVLKKGSFAAAQKLFNLTSTEQMQDVLKKIVKAEAQEAGEFLIPEISARIDEESKMDLKWGERIELNKVRNDFHKSVKAGAKLGWNVSDEIKNQAESSVCTIS